jgi:hypothetical protein
VGGGVAIESDDPVQLALLQGRVDAALEVRAQLDDQLAVAIARRIGELFAPAD